MGRMTLGLVDVYLLSILSSRTSITEVLKITLSITSIFVYSTSFGTVTDGLSKGQQEEMEICLPTEDLMLIKMDQQELYHFQKELSFYWEIAPIILFKLKFIGLVGNILTKNQTESITGKLCFKMPGLKEIPQAEHFITDRFFIFYD